MITDGERGEESGESDGESGGQSDWERSRGTYGESGEKVMGGVEGK